MVVISDGFNGEESNHVAELSSYDVFNRLIKTQNDKGVILYTYKPDGQRLAMAEMMSKGYVDLVTVMKTYNSGSNKSNTYTFEELKWYDDDIKKGYYDIIYAMRNH